MDAYDYEQLAGRVILVTGGGSGLGAAICTMLARDGAHLAVVDINETAAVRVVEQITDDGGTAYAAMADVGDDQAVLNMLGRVTDHFGRLDAIINSAGVDVTIGVRDMNVTDWNRVIATNLTGPF